MTTPYDIAAYIAQYANDENVKAELKKFGIGIVPNSLRQLVEKLEGTGKYKVIETETYQKLLNNQKEPETHSVQILGAKVETPEAQGEIKVVDPFGKGYLTPQNLQTTIKEENVQHNQEAFVGEKLSTGITPEKASIPFTEEQLREEGQIPQSGTETFEKSTTSEFKHFKEPPAVPENPLKKLWYDITQKASSEHSISFSSLIVNAIPIEIENNTLRIGFSSSHTYQMKQLKKKANTEKIIEVVRAVSGQNLDVSYEVLADRKESNLTLHITAEEKNANNERIHSLQILGGN